MKLALEMNSDLVTNFKSNNFEEMWIKIIEFYFNKTPEKISLRRFIIHSVVLEIDSINLGNLLLEEVGYGSYKMVHLWNSYICSKTLYKLKNKINGSLEDELFSFNYIFKSSGHSNRDNCLTSMTIHKFSNNIYINLSLRASEAVRTILGDFFLIHKLARFLFPVEYLENISVRFNCSYIYFSISTLIVILNNPRFKEILSDVNNPRVEKFKEKSNKLIKKGCKLISVQRILDYVKFGYIKDEN